MPLSLPFSSGKMSAMAVADPVEVGARFVRPDLARRRSDFFRVWRVHDCLSVGDVVNGGDGAADDAEVLLDDGDDGGEAVGGARRGGDDVVLVVVVLVVVHPVHDVEHRVILLLDGRGHQHLLDAPREVRFELRAGEKLAAALEDELHAVLVPRDVARGGVGGVRDRLSVDDDVPVDEGAILGPLPVDGIVLGEVGGRLARAGELVYVNKLQLGVVVREAEREASDASETWERGDDGRRAAIVR